MTTDRILRTRFLYLAFLASALSPALTDAALADLRTAPPDPARDAAAARAQLLVEKCAKLACRTQSRE